MMPKSSRYVFSWGILKRKGCTLGGTLFYYTFQFITMLLFGTTFTDCIGMLRALDRKNQSIPESAFNFTA